MATAIKSLDKLIDKAARRAMSEELKFRAYGWGGDALLVTPGVHYFVELAKARGTSPFWLFTDTGTWVPPEKYAADDSDDADTDFPHRKSYLRLWDKYRASYEWLQQWTLERRGDGACLMIHGGTTATTDDSLTRYPVQDYRLALFPWGGADEFTFFVQGFVPEPGAKRRYVAMLTREY